MLNYINDGERFAVYHFTKPNYTGKTENGISLGASRDEIIQAYKQPGRIINLADGYLMDYPKRNILFELNAEGKLKAWCVYRIPTNLQ